MSWCFEDEENGYAEAVLEGLEYIDDYSRCQK